jgi:hypothetical protein
MWWASSIESWPTTGRQRRTQTAWKAISSADRPESIPTHDCRGLNWLASSVMHENDSANRELARNALGSLPSVERFLCGALILRQLDRGPRIPREVDKYGPEGCVKVCSARAIQIYNFPLGVLAVGFAVAGVSSFAIGVFALVWLMGALSIVRAISASRAGRRWRSKSSTT